MSMDTLKKQIQITFLLKIIAEKYINCITPRGQKKMDVYLEHLLFYRNLKPQEMFSTSQAIQSIPVIKWPSWKSRRKDSARRLLLETL